MSPVSQRITFFAAAWYMWGEGQKTTGLPSASSGRNTGRKSLLQPSYARAGLLPQLFPTDDASSLFNSLSLNTHSDVTHQPPVGMWRLTPFHM